MKPADRFRSVLWAVVIVVALIGLGMFVATSRFTGLTAREFFGTAFLDWVHAELDRKGGLDLLDRGPEKSNCSVRRWRSLEPARGRS